MYVDWIIFVRRPTAKTFSVYGIDYIDQEVPNKTVKCRHTDDKAWHGRYIDWHAAPKLVILRLIGSAKRSIYFPETEILL